MKQSKKNILLAAGLLTAFISPSRAEIPFHPFEFHGGDLEQSANKLPIEKLTKKLLPRPDKWKEFILNDLRSQIDIPYDSVFEFVKEQEEFQAALQTLEQLPAPIITIATPLEGSNADFVAVAATTTWANQLLYLSEISFEYLSSHLGATLGLSTTGGLGTSAGIGSTFGLGATGGAGLATGVGVTAGLGMDIGVNTGAGGSITVGSGASLGLPITLNDIVTNTFNALRPRIWRVNTLSGDEVRTISPMLMTIGNPDQNPQTARLNDSLPLYFDRETDSDEWLVVQRKNSRQFEGHVGIISLSAQAPFEQIRFRDGIIGLDLITMVVAATDDQGMQAITKILTHDENGDYRDEFEILTAYLNSLMGHGMNITDKLKRLTHFTNLSRGAWSKPISPFSSLSKQGFEQHKDKFISKARQSHTGKLLHRLANRSKIKERITKSWVSEAVSSPDMLDGQVLHTSPEIANTSPDIKENRFRRLRHLSDYPAGMSLVVIADDDGVLQNIHLLAN